MLELKYQRTIREWSQAELGRRASIPRAYISMFETGRLIPYDPHLERLASVLEMDDPSALLEPHEEAGILDPRTRRYVEGDSVVV